MNYAVRTGFIGPLTRRQAANRAHNQAGAAKKKAQRAAAAICSNGGAHTWEAWDCGCSFGCECCSLTSACTVCGAKR